MNDGENEVTPTPSEDSEDSDSKDRHGSVRGNVRLSESPQQDTDHATKSVEASSQSITYPAAATDWLPLAIASAQPAAVPPPFQTPIPTEETAAPQTGSRTLVSELSSALPGSSSNRTPEAEQFAKPDSGTIESDWTSAGVQNRSLVGPEVISRNAPRNLTAHELPFSSAVKPSETKITRQAESVPREALPVSEGHRQPMAVRPAIGENAGDHFGWTAGAGDVANSKAAGTGKPPAAPHATRFEAPDTAGAADIMSSDWPEPSGQRVALRGIRRESAVATATSAVAVQASNSNPADSTPRSLLMMDPTTPGSSHDRAIVSASSSMSGHDTFAALDRETSLGAPTWTHAAGQHAEAGFRDPDLGWVGVRADLNASGVHATLVPSSADAAQTLSSHLAGLSSHLVEEHAQVASLSMASPGESGADGSGGQHMQQGTEGNPQGRTGEQPQFTTQGGASPAATDSTQGAIAESGLSQETRAYPGELRGRHISVIV